MWQQHVFSKRIRVAEGVENLVDGFHILTDGTMELYERTKRIKERPGRIANPDALTMENISGKLYIARAGSVGDVLGPDHYHAFERPIKPVKVDDRWVDQETVGRPISFVHGYVAPQGSGAYIHDLEELKEMQQQHLEEVLRRANAGEEHIQMTAAFTRPRASGTEWATIAEQFEKGQHKGKMAIFSLEGKLLEWVHVAVEQEVPAASHTMPPSHTPSHSSSLSSLNSSPASNTPWGKITLAVVAAISLVGGALWWQQRQRQEMKDAPRQRAL